MRGKQAKRLRAAARKKCDPNQTGYRGVKVWKSRVFRVVETIVVCAPRGFRATYQKLKREFKR